jgi:hypothetical protein
VKRPDAVPESDSHLNSNIEQSSTKGGLSRLLLCAIFLLLLASRRWDQLVSPQVWCEDAWLIEGFIKAGWYEFLLPLNGYLTLMPKLITSTSLIISIYHYPVISTVLTWVFTTFVASTVAFAPIHLRGKALCAISIFLIPSDPEVFGLPLYTLWWSAILLIVCALWDEKVPARFVRTAFVLAGGLSSPYIFIALPVFYFRAFRYRAHRAERMIAVVATIVAALQIPFVILGAKKEIPPLSSICQHVVPKFCGWFVLGNLYQDSSLLWAAGLSVVILVTSYLFFQRRDPAAWILFALFAGAIFSSIVRVDPSILVPSRAGPRYFFLPYVLTYWILIQLYLRSKTGFVRFLAATVVLMALLNAVPVWERRHEDMRWAENLRSSRLFPTYWIKAQYDGSRNSGFFIEAPGATWDALLRRDWFVSQANLQTLPTFAYRVVDVTDTDQGGAFSFSNLRIKFVNHEALLRLRMGDRVRFRSGKSARSQNMQIVGQEGEFISSLPMAANWVTLEFSNSRLPSEFTVKIVDQGQGVGEWSPAD